MAGHDPAAWASALCAGLMVRPPGCPPYTCLSDVLSRDDRSLGSLTRQQEPHAPHVKGFKLFQGPDTADHPDMRGRGLSLHNGPPSHPHAQPLGPGEVPRWGLWTGTPPRNRLPPGSLCSQQCWAVSRSISAGRAIRSEGWGPRTVGVSGESSLLVSVHH